MQPYNSNIQGFTLLGILTTCAVIVLAGSIFYIFFVAPEESPTIPKSSIFSEQTPLLPPQSSVPPPPPVQPKVTQPGITTISTPSPASKKFDPNTYRYSFFADIANQLINRLK